MASAAEILSRLSSAFIEDSIASLSAAEGSTTLEEKGGHKLNSDRRQHTRYVNERASWRVSLRLHYGDPETSRAALELRPAHRSWNKFFAASTHVRFMPFQ